MSELQRRYVRLLGVYPRTYRRERGDEILATLLEASPDGRRRPALRDVADIALHGVQMRLGLTSERFAGRVLDTAAAPGLALAAAFSLFFLACTELFPFLNRSYGLTFGQVDGHYSVVPQPHFGPFSTTGAVIYAVWLLSGGAATVWPTRQRSAAAAGVVVTLLGIGLGKAFFAAPRLPLMLVLVAVGLPAVLAPAGPSVRRLGGASAIAVAVLFGLMWWSARLTIRSEAEGHGLQHFFGSLYAVSVYNLGGIVLSVSVVAAVGILALVMFRRAVQAGAVAILAAPWLIIAASYHVQAGYDAGKAVLLLTVPLIGLVGAWVVDLVHGAKGPFGSVQSSPSG